MPSIKKLLQAAAGNAGESLYVEDVFSTYLYTGNGSTQTITNGIDLDGEGGLVWIKSLPDTYGHRLIDTERGVLKVLESYDTTAEATQAGSLTAFNSNGFSVGNAGHTNFSGNSFASWTFRKAEKFFDVVTYTGTGVARTVPHNLGSVPGCIIVKALAGAEDWAVYHRGNTANPETDYLELNTTNATADSAAWWNDTAPTDTEFTVGNEGAVNGNTVDFVAYVFAHDAGGFGDDGSESIIKCGSYTGTGATGNAINLGFEPQWVLVKRTDSADDWNMQDMMRGGFLRANTSEAELGGTDWFNVAGDNFFPTATGFQINTSGAEWNASGGNYIYIAIRRPMKTPESGTEVFSPNIWTGDGSPEVITTGFSPDVSLGINRGAVHALTYLSSRLTGMGSYLSTTTTAAENSDTASVLSMDGITINSGNLTSGFGGGQTYVGEFFKRATGFFDVVAYTGTGSATTQAHNLGVAPELMIVKRRSTARNWLVYTAPVGNTKGLYLNYDLVPNTFTGYWNDTTPTASVFTLGNGFDTNSSGDTYIAYLFATLAGVSKVGSYTGTAATLNVDCGFSAGARFILIKRTDSTGDWYVYDSARGIVAGDDPYLLLNTTAAEVTGTDYIDPLSSGFTVTSTAPAGLNDSGGTYIFLSIA